ncbi:hypothetical protein ACH5RR_027659 [Cinchona calisaya]|uniref:Uncharacterized protein n=1 Tax=Cinchona calisaya TaxID=153742 RepID=A0ABD2YLK1_9GENT
MDNNLVEFDENELKIVIDVALLCTQTSQALRPSISRVTSVTSRPVYLTDWKFKDATSYMSSDGTTSRSDPRYDSSMSMVTDQNYSPENAAEPILHVILGIYAQMSCKYY